MKKGPILGLTIALILLGGVIVFTFGHSASQTPVANSTVNVSQKTATIVGLDAEQLCADGQVKDRSFTGGAYAYLGCHAVPSDYNKACSNSIDCTNKCITTIELAKTAGCVEGGETLKSTCSMTGFCSATYDSGSFIEVVSGTPVLRADK